MISQAPYSVYDRDPNLSKKESLQLRAHCSTHTNLYHISFERAMHVYINTCNLILILMDRAQLYT